MVGIKGVGMASLAVLLKNLGATITGSDIKEYFHTQDDLEKHGITILNGFFAENISGTIDLIITTGAHSGLNNPEVIEGKKKGIPILTHAEALDMTMSEFTNRIAICGSHGKTTTTALVASMLKELNMAPAAVIGSAGNNFDDFKKDYFVVEADEYATAPPGNNTPRFMYLHPSVIVCTNIDYDHPDVYKDIHQTIETFAEFFKKIDDDGTIIAFGDDINIREALATTTWDRYLTYGLGQNNNLIISDVKQNEYGMSFKATLKKDRTSHVYTIPLFGIHNVLNAGAAILIGMLYGKKSEEISQAMSTFKGTKRRMEKIFEQNNTILFDDYGHHPTEINATLTAFKKRFTNNRLVVIFQPHTVSRTKALEKDFLKSLELADEIIITDIFLSAREKKEETDITAQDLVNHAEQKNKFKYIPLSELKDTLPTLVKKGDIIVTLGAGELYKYHFDIIKAIKSLSV
jgi:UDP-N-acetylmuramate--alanine ligase